MFIFIYINYIKLVSNISNIIIKITYAATFFTKAIKPINEKNISFLDLGNLNHGRKLLEDNIVIDGVEIYLPNYIYEIEPKDSYARESKVIQLWDLAGLPSHLEKSIHSFDWLYDLRAINSTAARRIALSWILEWVARYGNGKGPGWSIEEVSKRVIALVENNILFDRPPFGGSEPYGKANKSISKILSRSLKLLILYSLISFKNRDQLFVKSAIFFAEYYKGSDRKVLGKFLQRVGRISKRLINRHGEVESRNPEELLEFFVLLEKLRNYGRQLNAYGVAEGSFIDTAVMNAAKTLKSLRFENGRLFTGMGSDGGSDAFLNILSSVEYPKNSIKDGTCMGYCVMRADRVKIISDVENAPKLDRTGMSHAGMLSFEFSSGLRKIVVNCGSGHRHDSYIQRQNRSTYAHSTLELSDQSQARFLPVWPRSLRPQDRMFSMSQKNTKLNISINDTYKTLEAEHGCYESRFGITHKRALKLATNGNHLIGSDELAHFDPVSNNIPFRLYFHLHPDVDAWHVETNDSVILKLQNGETWLFTYKGGDLFLADSAYFGRGNITVRKSKQIVVSSNKMKYTKTIKWSFQNQTARPRNARDIGLEHIG